MTMSETQNRASIISLELRILNNKMQEILDHHGSTVGGQEKIRKLKIQHDKLLTELNMVHRNDQNK